MKNSLRILLAIIVAAAGCAGIDPSGTNDSFANAAYSNKLFSSTSESPADPAPTIDPGTYGPFAYSAEGSVLYGQINGYVQTPKGGRIGSTSLNRPRLSELDISTAVAYEGRVSVAFGHAAFYLGARAQQFTGSSRLSAELITKNKTFPSNIDIESYVGLDWYRFGYQHTYDLNKSHTLTLLPSAEVILR